MCSCSETELNIVHILVSQYKVVEIDNNDDDGNDDNDDNCDDVDDNDGDDDHDDHNDVRCLVVVAGIGT